MAHPFVLSPFDGDAYLAYLTTGERFYLVQVAGEVIELLGQDHMADSSDEEEQQDVSGARRCAFLIFLSSTGC